MPAYSLDTLANGLRIVTVEMPHLHSAEMVCYVGVGGRHETAGQAGISHFLEHVLFRGTRDYPSSIELEQAFEAIGGTVNAATDAETTCFHSRLHPGHLATGARLFASMLRHPLLADVDLERQIIVEEALEDLNEKGQEINPDNLTSALLWPGHPLGTPTIGTLESLAQIDRADLERYHRCHYRPGNTVVAVTGQVRRADAVAAVSAAFADWHPAAVPSPSPFLADGALPQSQAWVYDSDSQVAAQLAFRLPGRHGRQTIPLRMLRAILSGGGTSRLMLRLRERLALTYNVEANLTLFADSGCFNVDLSVAPTNLMRALDEILTIFEELCSDPVGDEELQRAIRNYLYDLDFSRDHPDDMAVRYGWGTLVDYLRPLELDRREMAEVSPAQLIAAAQELFTAENLVLAVVGPFTDADRGAIDQRLRLYRRRQDACRA